MTLTLVLCIPLLLLVLLFGCQRKMIYLPRQYDRAWMVDLPLGAVPVESTTSQGRQVAFYVPPRIGTEASPERLWVIHGGNGDLALNWIDFVADYPDDDAAFLLVDYPAYGLCEGKPTDHTVLENTEAAVNTLRSQMDLEGTEINLLGHSLGCAAALQWAARHDCSRLVLVSPFTSIRDMARRVVGWPLCNLVLDRYDNVARLSELAELSPRPSVTIIHGRQDNIVPVTMGRTLSGAHPDWIQFIEIPNGDHNCILTSARSEIIAAMMQP